MICVIKWKLNFRILDFDLPKIFNLHLSNWRNIFVFIFIVIDLINEVFALKFLKVDFDVWFLNVFVVLWFYHCIPICILQNILKLKLWGKILLTSLSRLHIIDVTNKFLIKLLGNIDFVWFFKAKGFLLRLHNVS